MEPNDEFYIGYSNAMGKRTSKLIRNFVLLVLFLIITVGFSFSFFQKEAVNSSFDYDTPTRISGTYHESPYPMLRMRLAENTYKDVVLLGFGKMGADLYLDPVRKESGSFLNKHITIEGNLIYYNGKTLLQIDENNKLTVDDSERAVEPEFIIRGEYTVEGEVIDPKCYFGVMKPGFGKIHRSCASLCIAGGIPPVLVATDPSRLEKYFLLTDLKGNPINKDILPYIGQPSVIKGQLVESGDWNILRIDVADIEKLKKNSSIY